MPARRGPRLRRQALAEHGVDRVERVDDPIGRRDQARLHQELGHLWVRGAARDQGMNADLVLAK